MDITNIPTITRCTTVSDNIREYFEEERYKVNFDEEEEITHMHLSLIAIGLVLDELDELGIVTSNGADDIYESELDMQIMLYLRVKLDKDNLYRTIKSLDEKNYSELLVIIEDCVLGEDLLLELADYMTAKFPLDHTWELINRSIDFWGSNDKFASHVDAILDKIAKEDNNQSCLSENNVGDITAYLERMRQRAIKLNLMCHYIIQKYPDLNMYTINLLKDRYDKDKLRPDVLPLFATYKEVEGQEEPSYVKHHHESTPHHLQYWEKLADTHERLEIKDQIATPSKEQCVMIVVSFVLDELDVEHMIKEIDKFKPYTRPEEIAFMHTLARLDYKTILGGN